MVKMWHWIVPPLDQRHASPLTPLFFLLTNCFMIGASYLALHHPRLSTRWRWLYLGLTSLLTVHLRLAYYTALPPRSMSDTLPWYAYFDGVNACAVMHIITSILESLFLADPQQRRVRGADAYRRYMSDKHPELDRNGLREQEAKLTGGGTYEQPRSFPGTTEPLYRDMISVRGLGYEFGLRQRGLVPYEGGYDALIASHKLQDGDPEKAKQIKGQQIKQVVHTLVPCWLAMLVCYAMVCHPKVVPRAPAIPPPSFRYTTFSEGSICPTWLYPWLLTALHGVVIVASLQARYALLYLWVLWRTPAPQVPITMGRWLPLLMQQPHRSTSISDMWSIHWHGLLRRSMTVLCMRPAKRLAAYMGWPMQAGRVMGVLASFLYSGLMHELLLEGLLPHLRHASSLRHFSVAELRAASYGWGGHRWAMTRFFVYMGLLVIVEDLWTGTVERSLAARLGRKGSNKLVHGRLRLVLAWSYTMGMMVYCGRELIDVWRLNGLSAVPSVKIALIRIACGMI